MKSQLAEMTPSPNCSDASLFILSSLVTGQKFISISSLVVELWQFSFITTWEDIPKLELFSPEFCLISRDWDELRIPNLVGMFLLKYYWILYNARVTAFTIYELLRGNQQAGVKLPPLPTLPWLHKFSFHQKWRVALLLVINCYI